MGNIDPEEREEGEVVAMAYPTEEEMLGLRTSPIEEASPYTKKLWFWYAGQALNAIPSKWNKARTVKLLHEEMTVSDEAFIMTIIVAYEDKWKEAVETPTDKRAGRKKGEKWMGLVVQRFTKYYKMVSEARDNKNANSWEVAFREHCRGLCKGKQEDKVETEEEGDQQEEQEIEIPDDL